MAKCKIQKLFEKKTANLAPDYISKLFHCKPNECLIEYNWEKLCAPQDQEPEQAVLVFCPSIDTSYMHIPLGLLYVDDTLRIPVLISVSLGLGVK